jgi:hypothetical protein
MQKHLKKTKNISATLEQIFLNGRILSAHLGVRDDDGVGREIIKEISNKDTAKRLYDEAVARMKDDPKYKKEWERSLETGKWVADKKWGVTAVHKGGKILLRMGPGVTPSSRS